MSPSCAIDDWDDLIGYCRYSAMPVGRFVLDVHGESRATWPANDALCAALQIINHLQDCAADYRDLDRVYIPLDALSAAGLTVAALGETKASPALRRCLRAWRTAPAVSCRTAGNCRRRSTTPALRLKSLSFRPWPNGWFGCCDRRDPLCEPVHLSKPQVALTGLLAMSGTLTQRLFRKPAFSRKPPAHG